MFLARGYQWDLDQIFKVFQISKTTAYEATWKISPTNGFFQISLVAPYTQMPFDKWQLYKMNFQINIAIYISWKCSKNDRWSIRRYIAYKEFWDRSNRVSYWCWELWVNWERNIKVQKYRKSLRNLTFKHFKGQNWPISMSYRDKQDFGGHVRSNND